MCDVHINSIFCPLCFSFYSYSYSQGKPQKKYKKIISGSAIKYLFSLREAVKKCYFLNGSAINALPLPVELNGSRNFFNKLKKKKRKKKNLHAAFLIMHKCMKVELLLTTQQLNLLLPLTYGRLRRRPVFRGEPGRPSK